MAGLAPAVLLDKASVCVLSSFSQTCLTKHYDNLTLQVFVVRVGGSSGIQGYLSGLLGTKQVRKNEMVWENQGG